MAEPTTFIKIDRNILDWGWYEDPNTKVVFLHLLLKANIKDHEYMGVMVRRGDVISSFPMLAKENGLSVQQVKTAISPLEATREVTHKGYAKFSLFTVVNYDKYQSRSTGSATDNQPTANRQLTDNQPHLKNIRIKERKKDNAHAREERREWEVRLGVREDLIGRFENEEAYAEFMY